MQEKGNLSINSENFMPIIKKWLYTDKDIFIRELVSNACDAVTKLQKLSMMGEADIPAEEAYKIHVVLDQDKKTLQIIDNGIGMTADEIKKYINQIAFSGATDFLSKFEGKTEDEGSEIIGHFGLGFYSAFMVADTVEIDSLSYQKGAEPAKWRCNGGIDYEMEAGERTERGTTITLFIGADGEEFLNEATLYAAMRKYCAFMPVPIFVDVLKEETEEEKASAKKAENTVHVSPEEAAKLTTEGAMDLLQEQQDAAEEAKAEEPKPLNDTNPLWQRKPSECTDEDYKAFYHQVFNDLNDPLFWIHLNMDYPFRLKGILYFPKLVEQMDMMDGEVKLYCNQVYIADNVKEVVPEFLLLLKGILDCPDTPLNVSRSALQNDGFVKKIAEYITKKVADKLAGMCKTDKEEYDKYWDDISPFIKFGCLKDDKFCEKMNDYILFKNLDGKYLTLPECLEIKPQDEEENKENAVDENGNKVEAEVVGDKSEDEASEENAEEEKKEKTIYYVTDEQQQSQYINMFKAAKMDAVILTHNIDQPFISQLEQKNEGIKFQRIDADVTDALKSKTSKKAEKEMEEQAESISKLMKKALKNDKITVKVEKLKNKKISSMITLSEESRRMQDMMKMYSMPGMDMSAFGGEGETLILNANHPLVQYITEHQDGENAEMICEQLYDLAKLQHAPLSADAMTKFVARSNDIMMLLTK